MNSWNAFEAGVKQAGRACQADSDCMLKSWYAGGLCGSAACFNRNEDVGWIDDEAGMSAGLYEYKNKYACGYYAIDECMSANSCLCVEGQCRTNIEY